MTQIDIKTIQISIFGYDPAQHRFYSDLQYQRLPLPNNEVTGEPDSQILDPVEAEKMCVVPSESWMTDYRAWNRFGVHKQWETESTATKLPYPHFDSSDDLQSFNEQGRKLSQRLRHELQGKEVIVKEFEPIYSNIQVGDAVSGWWHIKDQNYGFVVPIQQLPVSDRLKSRIMGWRLKKSRDWLDPERCNSFNREGHDLEEHILWELNVQTVNGKSTQTALSRMPSRQESAESIQWGK